MVLIIDNQIHRLYLGAPFFLKLGSNKIGLSLIRLKRFYRSALIF